MFLFFAPGIPNIQITVPVADDDVLETDEIFFGNLGLPFYILDDTIFFHPDRATATIQDNEST